MELKVWSNLTLVVAVVAAAMVALAVAVIWFGFGAARVGTGMAPIPFLWAIAVGWGLISSVGGAVAASKSPPRADNVLMLGTVLTGSAAAVGGATIFVVALAVLLADALPGLL